MDILKTNGKKVQKKMKCWHCNSELIWGGDHDLEDDWMAEEYDMQTNLSCPECQSLVLVFHAKCEISDISEDE